MITISLLDPIRGDAIQSWEFDGATQIRIGRAETNDIVLSDSEVSRLHGELTLADGVWSITPFGRNGIAISGRELTGITPVTHETVLRLAINGPYLEFRLGRRQNTPVDRLADRQRWETREREQDQQRCWRTDVTEVDFLKRRPPGKPAN